MPKTYRPDEVIQVLEYVGWRRRPGRGDHVNLNKQGVNAVVTVDTGANEVPKGTFGSILRRAGISRKEFDALAEEIL